MSKNVCSNNIAIALALSRHMVRHSAAIIAGIMQVYWACRCLFRIGEGNASYMYRKMCGFSKFDAKQSLDWKIYETLVMNI